MTCNFKNHLILNFTYGNKQFTGLLLLRNLNFREEGLGKITTYKIASIFTLSGHLFPFLRGEPDQLPL
jgi:hypothetical protein